MVVDRRLVVLGAGVSIEAGGIDSKTLLHRLNNAINESPLRDVSHKLLPSDSDDLDSEKLLGYLSFLAYGNRKSISSEFSSKLSQFQSTYGQDIFVRFYSEVVSQLEALIRIESTRLVFLESLIRSVSMGPEELRVLFTLNYDDGVEMLAADSGLQCMTSPGSSLISPAFLQHLQLNPQFALVKLNGSIDWYRNPEYLSSVIPNMPAIYDLEKAFMVHPYRLAMSCLSETIDYQYRLFREYLLRCNHLILIGYGGKNELLNVIISDWTNRATPNKITIANPEAAAISYLIPKNPKFTEIELMPSKATESVSQLFPRTP